VYKFTSIIKFVFIHLFSRKGKDTLRKKSNNFLYTVLIIKEILLAFSLKLFLYKLIVASLFAIS
jgi:hypothetical protein